MYISPTVCLYACVCGGVCVCVCVCLCVCVGVLKLTKYIHMHVHVHCLDDHESDEFLKLEDITHRYQHPCIMDVKVRSKVNYCVC